MEPVFRALEIAGTTAVRVTGARIDYEGLEHIPTTGGAVLAINHTSYVDFLPAALAAKRRGRRLRFMIKAEMQRVRIVDFLIRHTKTIPVDRRAGADAYAAAVARLREGEIVGVYPEATISRSFELKEFKSGAARMALEAQVPIIPLVVWGAHRIWTKDHPKQLGHNRIPITVAVGEGLPPVGTAEELMDGLRARMTALLHGVQQSYDHPRGAHWVPYRLGGSAPTMAEARKREADELADRARKENH
ncbi:1-acyl-sn-glycerol-3-phosphate acyltransferase [Mycolicibacterium madagascariense]|uniref:1-acyl-sn-glycerol-3-phosphate acyltransferase n=1 Tax=Mycolicibacterium madagascariense TaxID=212765 RepID=A0A7I7XNR2_9MYCO|nr:lysophospholipid acyltransferase family protein [Mycolicibacterium madagascariense]MCV7012035.1 1-acyl-sn-glycerol-3-phosphate acyltransferase [Mycolicibacterium madagascariense]BBZ30888.1 1-acyl-sn-glycerol-3-phosphate acyltransferase [Mycolicibacterium madagascariense]